MDNENTTSGDNAQPVTETKTSLKDKLTNERVKTWAKRIAIIGGTVIATIAVVTVVRKDETNEEA